MEFIISIAFGAVPVKDTNVAKAVEHQLRIKSYPMNAALNKTLGISLNFNVRRRKHLLISHIQRLLQQLRLA